MATVAEKIIKTHNDLKGQRANWDSLWQEQADYIVPHKNEIQAEKSPGTKRMEKVFDATAIHANNLLSAAMQGNLTNSTMRWFILKMQDEELNEVREVAVWLEEVAQRIFLALRQANFNSEAQELYVDLGAFGTGALFVAEKTPGLPDRFAGLRFKSFPVGSYVIAESAEGIVNTIYRRFKLSIRAMADVWGEKNIGEDLQKKLEKSPYERVNVLHGVFPRKGVIAQEVSLSTPAKKLPFASFYIVCQTKHLLGESGYHEFPYMVPRWSKSSGEVYGRGPGMMAMPDIKTLNVAVKQRLKAWALALGPPLKVRDRGVIGRVKLSPYSLNSVKNMDDIQALDVGSRFDVSNIQESQLKESIRQIFFIDQLQFPPKPGTPISATEAQIRFEMMQRVLGPTLGRLENELLSPLIDRVFRILLRADALPPVPEEVLVAVDENRAQIDVEYQGPLAVAQRAAGIEAVQRVYATLTPIAEVVPDVLDTIDHDRAARFIAKTSGLPLDLIRSLDQVEAIREARVRVQAEESQREEMESGAKAVGKIVPALKALGETAGAET